MSDLKQLKINDLIQKYNLMMQIIKNGTEEEKVKYLMMQHTTNEHILKDLGYIPNDKDATIRELREQLRELEKQKGGEITASQCCNFAKWLSSIIDNHFKSLGICAYPNISIGESISIKLNHLQQLKPISKHDYRYYRDEMEIKNHDKEIKPLIKKSEQLFDFTEKERGNDKKLILNNKNTELLIAEINQLLSSIGLISNISFKSDLGRDKCFIINYITFNLICTESNKSFMKAMEKFNQNR